MYPITIKREKQLINFHKSVDLGDVSLTLELLEKHVSKGETFSIDPTDVEDHWNGERTLNIFGKRLESDKEYSDRIAKHEKYMEGYNKFHSKKK